MKPFFSRNEDFRLKYDGFAATSLRTAAAKAEAEAEVEAGRLHEIGFHFSQLADEVIRIAVEAEQAYATWTGKPFPDLSSAGMFY